MPDPNETARVDRAARAAMDAWIKAEPQHRNMVTSSWVASWAEVAAAVLAVADEAAMSPDLAGRAREGVHFAPYGATNAACGETVPRSVTIAPDTGEYADARFTVQRGKTTCRECLHHLRRHPAPPSDDLRERVRGALSAARLGEDDVHVFYVAERHLDTLADAVLAVLAGREAGR